MSLNCSGGYAGWSWINPDGSNPETPFQLTVKSEDLDEWGVYTMIRPDNQDISMAFVANKIKLTGISGQIEDLFVDFIGAYVDNMPNDDWANDDIGTALIINNDGYKTIEKGSAESKTECIESCKYRGEIKGAYAGIRKIDENKYKCICLDRTMKGVVGMLKDPPFDPLNSLKTQPEGVNPFFIYKR